MIALFVCPFAEVQVEGPHRTCTKDILNSLALTEVVERNTGAPGLCHIRNISLANIVVLYFTPVSPCKKEMFCTLHNTKSK